MNWTKLPIYERDPLERAKDEAGTWARRLGHDLGPWKPGPAHPCYMARCRHCGGYAEAYPSGVVYYVFREKRCPGGPQGTISKTDG